MTGPQANGNSAGAVIFLFNEPTPGPRDIFGSDEIAVEVPDAVLESVLTTALGVDCKGGPVVCGVSGGRSLANIAGDINGVADGCGITGVPGTAGTGSSSSTIGSGQMLC